MIAGYRDGQLIGAFTVEGACNRSVFELWIETCLIPVLRPGEWVIVDNATFHHGGRIAPLIEAAGCQLVYLRRPIHPTSTGLRSVGHGLKIGFANCLPKSDNLWMRWKPFSLKQRPTEGGYSYTWHPRQQFRHRPQQRSVVQRVLHSRTSVPLS